MKNKAILLQKITNHCDSILCLLYSFLIFLSMADSATYNTRILIADYKTLFVNICIIYALFKIWLFFDVDRTKSLVAIVSMTVVILLKVMELSDFLFVVVLAIALFNSDYDRLVKFYTATSSVFLFVTFICAETGVIRNVSEYNILENGRPVYSLGFISHNAYTVYYLFTSLAIVYLTRECRYQIHIMALLMMVSICLYYITDSRTGFFLNLFACFSILTCKLLSKIKEGQLCQNVRRYLGVAFVLTPIFSVFVTFIGVLFYNKYQRTLINGTLISRYFLLDNALEIAGIRLPNQTISTDMISKEVVFNWMIGTGKGYIDGGDILYGQIFLNEGVPFLLIYLLIHVFVLYVLYKKNKLELLVIYSTIAILGALESVVLDFKFYIFELFVFTKAFDFKDIFPKKLGWGQMVINGKS